MTMPQSSGLPLKAMLVSEGPIAVESVPIWVACATTMVVVVSGPEVSLRAILGSMILLQLGSG